MIAGDLAHDLVTANRILVAQGIVDAFGHVSLRDREHPDRFHLARNLAPARVTTADLMTFAFDGTALDGDTRTPYLERFIHSAIYRARPDVGAVVHSHAAAVIPFGVAGVPLRPLFHMSSFLLGPVPLFEIREAAGEDNDMLVRSDAHGRALAERLGDGPAVLMRGHGMTVVGDDVRQAVFRAVFTAQNAQLQTEALRLGGDRVTYLSASEARNATGTNAGQVARAWDVWSAGVAGP